MTSRADVVVVGAGISGLAAAYSARKAGASVLLLEASANVGGVMQTDKKNGFLIEQGPTSMAATEESIALLNEIGLSGRVVRPPATAKRRFVVRDGKMHALPSSPGSLISSELLSLTGKLRLLAEPFVPRASRSAREESLAEIVRRRFGREVLEYTVDPFVSGICAGDPRNLSSRHVLRAVSDLEQEFGSVILGAMKRARRNKERRDAPVISFRSGMSELPRALREALGNACVFDAQLTNVELLGSHCAVTYQAGGHAETVLAESLVCALPSHVLSAINWPYEWRSNINRVSAVKYAPIATVAMGFRRSDIAHPLDGFGVLIPSCEKRTILGALFNSSMFEGRATPDHVLVTAFVGGTRWASAQFGNSRAFSDEYCAQTAIAELTPLLGISAAPVMISVTRREQGIPQLEIGHDEVIAAAAAIENSDAKIFFTGSYLSGAAVGDCLAHGSRVGERAAAYGVRGVAGHA